MATPERPAPALDPVPVEESQDARYRHTLRVTLVGSVVDLVLGVAKLFFGFAAHSQALIADGIHSLSDLVTDGLVIYVARHSRREADEEHPYGHGRFETVATVALGMALIAVAGGIAYDAARRLFDPDALLQPGYWALIVAGASIVLKEIIYHYTMHAARRHRSEMLRANAWHSRTDAISSVVVLVGVGGTMLGLHYLDALAAIGVALLIAKIGWDLAWRSVSELVDTSLDPERVNLIRDAILNTHGVSNLHMLRTRRMGGDALVDVHVQVEPELSVSEGHQISEQVRSRLIAEVPEVADVTVHIDTEDDQAAADSLQPPLRHVLEDRLRRYFEPIDAARRIERITLHYRQGRIHVELLLPLDLVKDPADAESLERRFDEAVKDDPDIDGVSLHFSA